MGAVAHGGLSQKERRFCWVLGFFLLLAAVLPSIPQDGAYHHFVDTRSFFGIPRALDVLTNVGFLIAGLVGLYAVAVRKNSYSSAFVWSMTVFFIGVLGTAAGSAYYHWAPDSTRLVWDRLPMTIAFSGTLGALATCRVSDRAGRSALPFCLVAGVVTIAIWQGSGNLTPYGVMQIGGFVWVFTAWLFGQKNPGQDLPWGQLLGWYGAAKIAEHFDVQIFDLLGGAISGHSIKHLLSGVAAFSFARHLVTQRVTKQKVDQTGAAR